MAQVNIKRGSDKSFVIKLRALNGDPINITDMTQITVKIPKKDNTKLVINLDSIPTSYAKILYKGVTFTAVTAGPNGNLISLVFNGSQDIGTVVAAWNLANPANQVTHNGVNVNILDAGTAKLTGGLSSYVRVEKIAPYVLGKMKINLRNPDTLDLKLGQCIALEVLLDEGLDPEGEQQGFVIADAVNII